MTANQIAYQRHLEDVRTHVTQETETQRANREKERIQEEGNRLNYDASLYASSVAARNAELNYQASLNAASLNYASNVYATDVNAQNQKYKTDTEWALGMKSANETTRHNVVMEKQGAKDAGSKMVSAIGSVINTGANLVRAVLPFVA